MSTQVSAGLVQGGGAGLMLPARLAALEPEC